MDKDKRESMYAACLFDLCAYEGDSQQDALRCQIMEEFNRECLLLAQRHNRPGGSVDWREKTECRKCFAFISLGPKIEKRKYPLT